MDVQITPENSAASPEACQILNRILAYDGFSAVVKAEAEAPTGFFGELARAIDQELEDLTLRSVQDAIKDFRDEFQWVKNGSKLSDLKLTGRPSD